MLNPLWGKAPFVLLRYPGLFVSLALGALLLSLAAAAYPLFISASATELVRAGIEAPEITRWGAGVSYRNWGIPIHTRPGEDASFDRLEREFGRLTGTSPYLAPPVKTILGPIVPITGPDGGGSRQVRLFAGDGATEHVEIVDGAAGSGALVPDLVADALGIEPGDEVTLSPDDDGPGSVSFHVDGVYRSLYRGDVSGFWRPWNDELILYCSDCPPPPQPLIVDERAFLDVSDELRFNQAGYAWQSPIGQDLTLDEAREAARRSGEITGAMSDRGTRIGRLFSRCYLRTFCNFRTQAQFGSGIGDVVRDVEGRVAAIEGPARLLRAAGVLVAFVVVAAAGAFAMATRRVESTLLFARGARPRAVGTRGALEALLPGAVGAALGLGLAFLLVRAVGPGDTVAASANRDALRAAVLAGVGAVVAIGVVSAVSFLRQSEHHRSRWGILARLPWELLLAALSLLVLAVLRDSEAFQPNQPLEQQTPSLLLLVFPVLFLAGFAALAARALVIGVRAARNRSGGLSPAPYLAVHRLAARPRLTMLLIAASALCLGLFVQAQTVASSAQATVDAKAGVFVGSDVQARIDHIYETPTEFPLPLTRVVRRLQAGEIRARLPYDLLGIDARTFESAAFWDDVFASKPLGELIQPLTGSASAGVPVVLANWTGPDPSSITLDTVGVPIRVVGRATAFPGMSTRRPLVVVDQRRLEEAFEGNANPFHTPGASDELWIRGDTDEVVDALPTLPYVPELLITADEVKDIPYISAVIDTFIVMNGLGLAAGVLVLVAMLMYLQARQRSEIVSYGLSLRMGLAASAHLRAIAAEVGTMLAVAFVAGALLAVIAASLTVPLLDPLGAIPPEPITVVPIGVLVATIPVLLLAAFGGGWLIERRARRADLGQVMRLAD